MYDRLMVEKGRYFGQESLDAVGNSTAERYLQRQTGIA
jgi:hypothetical protein